MRRGVLVLLAVALTLAAGALVVRQHPGPPAPIAPAGPAAERAPGRAPATTIAPAPPGSIAGVPRAEPAALGRAREVLAAIEARGGAPLDGYVGGRTFNNRERRLPAGRYREYDVHPRVSGRDRGPERVVIEQTTGRAYYTGDHYRTFVPLN